MSGVIGPLYHGGHTIPNRVVPLPDQQQPAAIYGLRATPPIFTVITRMGNANFALMPYLAHGAVQRKLGTMPVLVFPRQVGAVELEGLVRVRALGGPLVSPQVRLSGLERSRALGTSVVSTTTTPPEPPVPPTPPYVPPSSPRNLRYVRRRNRPRET